MGILWSWLGFENKGRTDDPDPVTGLTSRDKYHLRKTWGVVKANPTENGVALLNLLFDTYPAYLQLFPFKDVPRNELPANKRYQAHCNAVVHGFSSILDALDDTDLVIVILTKLADSHVPRKVGESEFTNLKGVIINLFSQLFNQEEMDSWKKALEVVFSVINKAVRENLEKK